MRPATRFIPTYFPTSLPNIIPISNLKCLFSYSDIATCNHIAFLRRHPANSCFSFPSFSFPPPLTGATRPPLFRHHRHYSFNPHDGALNYREVLPYKRHVTYHPNSTFCLQLPCQSFTTPSHRRTLPTRTTDRRTTNGCGVLARLVRLKHTLSQTATKDMHQKPPQL